MAGQKECLAQIERSNNQQEYWWEVVEPVSSLMIDCASCPFGIEELERHSEKFASDAMDLNREARRFLTENCIPAKSDNVFLPKPLQSGAIRTTDEARNNLTSFSQPDPLAFRYYRRPGADLSDVE